MSSSNSGSRRKSKWLPQPKGGEHEAPPPEPEESETLATVEDPEEAAEPDPPLCPKCLEAGSNSGAPFVGSEPT